MKKTLLINLSLITGLAYGLPKLQDLAARAALELPTTSEAIEDTLAKAIDAPGTLAIIECLPQAVQEAFANQPLLKLPPERLAHFSTVFSRPINAVAYNKRGSHIASGSPQSTIFIMNARTKKHLQTLIGHTAMITSLDYSPDDRSIASGSYDQTIKIWDTKTGECVHTLPGHTESIQKVVYSPSGAHIASLSYSGITKIWDTHTGECINTLPGRSTALAYNPKTEHLATGYANGTIKIWNSGATTCLQTFSNPADGYISPIAFSPDGEHLAYGFQDIHILDANTGEHLNTLPSQSNIRSVNKIVYSPNGAQLTTTLLNGTIIIWDLKTLQPLHIIYAHDNHIDAISYSANGSRLISGSADNSIKIWNTSTGRHVTTLPNHTADPHPTTHNSRRSEVARIDRETIILADKTTRLPRRVLVGHPDPVNVITYSPNGAFVASGSCDKAVKVWNAETGDCMHTLTEHARTPEALAFSPDESQLASGSWDTTIKIWDVRTGRCLHTLLGHQKVIQSLKYSPSGSYLASGSTDGTLRIWNPTNGECLQVIPCNAHNIESIKFSPNSSIISFASPRMQGFHRDSGHTLIKCTTMPRNMRIVDFFVLKFLDRYSLPSRDEAPRIWGIIDSCSQPTREIMEKLIGRAIDDAASEEPMRKKVRLSVTS